MRFRRIEPWPIAVIGLLVAMIGSSLAFFRIAAANPDPLVVQDAYGAGREYSERVRAARRTRELGWAIELDAVPSPDGVSVRVSVRDDAGGLIAVDGVRVRRERPTEGGLDAEFRLEPARDGFAGAIPLPRPGRWHLVVRAKQADRDAERTFGVRRP